MGRKSFWASLHSHQDVFKWFGHYEKLASEPDARPVACVFPNSFLIYMPPLDVGHFVRMNLACSPGT